MFRDKEFSFEDFDRIDDNHEFTERYLERKEELIRKYSVERRHDGWRPLSVVAAVTLMIAVCTVTVYASIKLYRLSAEPQGRYSYELKLEKENTGEQNNSRDDVASAVSEEKGISAKTEFEGVKINVGYIPAGFVNNGKGEHTYKAEEGDTDRGYYISDLIVDTDGKWTDRFVISAEKLFVGSHEALLVYKQNSADTEWKNADMYISFPEYERVIYIFGWGHIEREELLKVAEGITLEGSGETVSVKDGDVATWSRYIDYKKDEYSNFNSESVENSQDLRLSVSEEEMGSPHKIGDAIVVCDTTDVQGKTVKVSARVKDFKIMDDFSLLKPEVVEDVWYRVLDGNGKLGTCELRYIRDGDGINSVSEVVRTEDKQLKLAFVSVEYTNEGEDDLTGFRFFGSLMNIYHENGEWRLPSPSGEGYDYVDFAVQMIGTGEMAYYAVEGDTIVKNYLPSIAPGESKTVDMAWIIDVDDVDDLYLNLGDSSGSFTAEDIKRGYVMLTE